MFQLLFEGVGVVGEARELVLVEGVGWRIGVVVVHRLFFLLHFFEAIQEVLADVWFEKRLELSAGELVPVDGGEERVLFDFFGVALVAESLLGVFVEQLSDQIEGIFAEV